MNSSVATVAREFHAATKYSLVNEGQDDADILMGTSPELKRAIGEQSPSNEPHPFKVYTTLDPLALPREFPALEMPLLDAIEETGERPTGSVLPDRTALARICQLSNGILKRGTHGTGRVIEYRAAGGTGARYHLELYLVCGDLPDLDAGIYHYSASDHTLRRLRSGDYRATLTEATGSEPSVVAAPAVIVATSTFWRNAWRYQERAYRHVYWDLGTTIANVLAVASASGLPNRVVMGFADAQVNALLGVDGEREATVCLVPLGRDGTLPGAPDLLPINHPTRPVSNGEIDFPLIRSMHAASSLGSAESVAAWRSRRPKHQVQPERSGERIQLAPLGGADRPSMSTDEAIRRRRSTRNYDPEVTIPFAALSTLLTSSNQPVSSDFMGSHGTPLVDQYLIVNGVESLRQGIYAVEPARSELEPLGLGDFRDAAAGIACAQGYAATGQVNIYYLVNLEPLLDAWGDRGYRVAQFEGALRAGKLHLATHTMGLGAVGSTSVDDEVIRLFSPHAAGKSYMFVLVFGKRRRAAG